MDLFSATNNREIDNTMSDWLSRRLLSGNHDSEFYIRPIIIIYDFFSDSWSDSSEVDVPTLTCEVDDIPIEINDSPTLIIELDDITSDPTDIPMLTLELIDSPTPARDGQAQINVWDDDNSEYDYYEYENYDILHIPSGCVCLYDFDTEQHLLNNWIVENKYISESDIVFNTPSPAA